MAIAESNMVKRDSLYNTIGTIDEQTSNNFSSSTSRTSTASSPAVQQQHRLPPPMGISAHSFAAGNSFHYY